MNQENLNEQIKRLILEYMKEENQGNHAQAEKIHEEIKQIKRLCGGNCID